MSEETTRAELDARNELEKELVDTPADTLDAAMGITGLKKAMRSAYYIAARLNRHANRLTAGQRLRFRAVAAGLSDSAPLEAAEIEVSADPAATADAFEACGDSIARRLSQVSRLAEVTKQDLMKNLQNIEMKSKQDKSLRMLVDWKDFEARTGRGKQTRLGELTVDDVKTLLVCLRGGKD